MKNFVYINNKKTFFNKDQNLLEVIRSAGIEIPTFCYHSELSVYGACRMCLVENEKGQLMTSCSTTPQSGMKIFTHTQRVQKIRKTIVELLLANHHQDCTTCEKSGHCKLQQLANDLKINNIRFKPRTEEVEKDTSSLSIVRDPNKCILCGDCVRVCSEVQGLGCLDFMHRGPKISVSPAFNKNIGDVECVNCGQCVSVCPTGALTIKDDTKDVWDAINDTKKTVIAQIAPAVRVSIGEEFDLPENENALFKTAAALRLMGVNKIFDTSFTADLTVVEETSEFLTRVTNNKNIPQFTSCCPSWVTYVERNHPDLMDNLSTCKSPQQMFGSVAKNYYAKKLGKNPDEIYVVSIMPCTSKKYEAARPEFTTEGNPDVDKVITTVELSKMIKEMGIKFNELQPESLDMPFGLISGAGLIFGNSGGVAEAALRLACEKLGCDDADVHFYDVRGYEGLKEATVNIGGNEINVAVASGLANAEKIAKEVKEGKSKYHLIEVMSCRGGCIGGGGQITPNNTEERLKRTEKLYKLDETKSMKKAQDNPAITELYADWLSKPNSKTAHTYLHTHYTPKQRIKNMEIIDEENSDPENKLEVSVCIGTNCFVKGSYDLMKKLIELSKAKKLDDKIEFKGTFCLENCACGPSIKVGAGNNKYGVNLKEAEEFFEKEIIPQIRK